ncbi:hypothetical protein QYE76_043304 [Lolium multiflorum]|uniref:Uncharacterized protein n=1 Tax=Lolium multiflorum TaxID=4521 RepID=A0AAD8WXT4_LOLMU|nr:hypothetical protein QYE76_043304 [Lolium multiflorum]
MENYSLLMGAAAVMKMAVEMAAVSMEKPSGGTSPLRQRAGTETRQAGEIDNLTVSLGQSILVVLCRFHVGAGITGVAPHYISPPSTFNVLLDSYWTNIDPNNVPLASLVAQEEHVDVNFIKNNNFNNNAYRNNSSNNYRPYPYNNGNGYGNSYGNSYNNNRNSPPGLEAMLKEFISTQTAFNKSVEEKLGKIDILASKVDSLAADVDLLKSKVLPNENHHNKITTTENAIQVRINENIRLMAELRARWDREENEKLAKEKNIAKVWTITTTSNANATHVAAPPTNTNKRIGVSNVSTSNAKREKLPETAKTAETACDKAAEIFSNIGDDDPIALDYNGLNFDDCHISEVIKFLQKLAKSPNASAINLAFTHHITNALIKAREEKLEREASIPKKLEDGWEPIIKMKVKDFDCNALCDLGASISVMPKKIYNMLDLPPLKNCYLDVNLADHSTKKPLGKVDNVCINVNNNLVPVDFVVLDIECNASCPIILGRPFLRTVGAIIDMKEGYADKPPFKPLPPKEGNEEKEEKKKKKKKGTKKKKKKKKKKKENKKKEEVFKGQERRMMRSRRVKSLSLGMPRWFIPAYFKKTQASKLGDAQGIPFFIDKLSGLLERDIFDLFLPEIDKPWTSEAREAADDKAAARKKSRARARALARAAHRRPFTDDDDEDAISSGFNSSTGASSSSSDEEVTSKRRRSLDDEAGPSNKKAKN